VGYTDLSSSNETSLSGGLTLDVRQDSPSQTDTISASSFFAKRDILRGNSIIFDGDCDSDVLTCGLISLAAYSLQQIGLLNATDIIGGYEAWKNAGLPVDIDSIERREPRSLVSLAGSVV